MSLTRFVSPATSWAACEVKATKRPSELVEAESDDPSAWRPPVRTLTRAVTPLSVSRRKTSGVSFVSAVINVEAYDVKATKRPSALIEASVLSSFPSVPSPATLALVVVAA
jgi:hypothetical protein